MANLQSRFHTRPMTEVSRVALRAIGVVLPGASTWGLAELRGGVPNGDYGTLLGAMGLSLLAGAVWSGIDAQRAPAGRVLTRWVATAFVVGCGLGLGLELMAPGGPPLFVSLLFYGVPLLVAAGCGVAVCVAVCAAHDS